MSTDRIPLEASRPRRAAGLAGCTDPPPSQVVDATILLRRHPSAGAQERLAGIMRGEAPPLSREQAAEVLGADPNDLQQVLDFAASSGLAVTGSSASQRHVKVSGTVAQMETAFGIKLRACVIDGQSYLTYEEALMIPASLSGVIVGVLGLDQLPVARH